MRSSVLLTIDFTLVCYEATGFLSERQQEGTSHPQKPRSMHSFKVSPNNHGEWVYRKSDGFANGPARRVASISFGRIVPPIYQVAPVIRQRLNLSDIFIVLVRSPTCLRRLVPRSGSLIVQVLEWYSIRFELE